MSKVFQIIPKRTKRANGTGDAIILPRFTQLNALKNEYILTSPSNISSIAISYILKPQLKYILLWKGEGYTLSSTRKSTD